MFEPDYRNILNCARNIESARLPLYEHIVAFETIGATMPVESYLNMIGIVREYRGDFR